MNIFHCFFLLWIRKKLRKNPVLNFQNVFSLASYVFCVLKFAVKVFDISIRMLFPPVKKIFNSISRNIKMSNEGMNNLTFEFEQQ